MKKTISLTTIYLMTFLIPVLVLPKYISNPFDMPKVLALIIGISALIIVNANDLRITRCVLLLMLFNIFSLFYTLNPYYTKIAVTLNISCLFYYIFVSQYIDSIKAKWLLIVIMISGLCVAVITWLQFFDIFILLPWLSQQTMIVGTVGNSNYLGAYLIFPLIATIGLLFIMDKKLIPAVILPVILGAFIIARARSSWVGFAITLPFFFYLIKPVWMTRQRTLMAIFGLLFGCYCLWGILPDRIKYRSDLAYTFLQSETIRNRLFGYYPAAFKLWQESPLFGMGMWSYRNQVYEAQRDINRKTGDYFEKYENPKPRRAHCEYLEVLVDGGLVYGVLYLWLFAGVLQRGFKFVKYTRGRQKDRFIVITSIAILIGVLGTALSFFPFRIVTTLFITFIVMGIIDGISK